jgi:RNA polymerase sigma-70 factor (ECF subfamily)
MTEELPLSDQELLTAIGRGDQQAFTVLFERHRNRLYNYLLRVTKSSETSEEIVLDVFVKIWQGRSLLYEVDHFEAFLFCIARNKAIDFLRWMEKRKSEQIELWNRMHLDKMTELPDARICLEQTRQLIDDAVGQLSPQRRQAFQLSRDHDLTYDQIAARMHISSHTVRNHIAASLQFIRYNLSTGAEMICLLLLLRK